MKDREIDALLERSAASHPLDPALLSRVSASLSGIAPVRPIAPAWILALALFLMSALLATASGYLFGSGGIGKLGAAQLWTIFPALAIFTGLAAFASVNQMTPGAFSPRPAILLLGICAAWLVLDAILFPDLSLGQFVPQGIPCLRAGLIVAIPAGLFAWLILRRGFAVNPSGAGLAAGTFAGLCGLIMLEIHCPNFRAPHVMLWHTAVIPISSLAALLLARR